MALQLWAIYRHPLDYPDSFVTRRFVLTEGFPVPDPLPTAVSATLDGARAAVPRGKVCLGRDPRDEPQIVESWI